jgi:hypothetical protein
MMRDDAVIDDQLKLKLTIALDENPDLFRALRDIKDPRRRTRRLKDLAVKGLLMERAPAPVRAEAPMGEPEAPPRAAIGQSVSSMLDWGDGTGSSVHEGAP